MNKKIIPILLAVFLVTTACGFTIPERATPEAERTDFALHYPLKTT